MISNEGENLVFIFSTPRAGSTLFSAILGNHSKIFAPPEYWLMLPLASIMDEKSIMVTQYDHELARKAWRSMITKPQFNQAAKEFAVSIYNSHLADSDKEILVDKTPRYYHIIHWIDELFPLAKKIWIKRSPLDVFASTKKSWEISIDELVGEYLSPHSLDYTIAFQNLSDFFNDEKTAENKFVLTYENLVSDPSTTIQGVCDFLSIQFDENMINYGENRNDKANNEGTEAMGDINIRSYSMPHSHSIGKWKESLTVLEVQKILDCLGRRLFEDLGYATEYSQAIDYASQKLRINRGNWTLDEIRKIANTPHPVGGFLYSNLAFTKISRENNRLRKILYEKEEAGFLWKVRNLFIALIRGISKIRKSSQR